MSRFVVQRDAPFFQRDTRPVSLQRSRGATPKSMVPKVTAIQNYGGRYPKTNEREAKTIRRRALKRESRRDTGSARMTWRARETRNR